MTSVEETAVPEQDTDVEMKEETGENDVTKMDTELEIKIEEGAKEDDDDVEELEEELEEEEKDDTAVDEEGMDVTGQEDNTDINGEKLDTSQDQKDSESPDKEALPSIIKIQDQMGIIFRSLRYHAILVQFMYKGKMEVAMAPSARMHINGSHPLVKICWRDMILRGFLREGDTVYFDATCTKPKRTVLPQKGKQRLRKVNPQSKNWNIELMWKGPKPDIMMLNTGEKFEAQETYLDEKMKQLEVHMKEVDEFNEKKVGCKKMQGEIKEFLSATHGTMNSGTSNVIFTAEDLLIDGVRISEEQTLADVLHSGDTVTAFVKEKPLEYGSVTYPMQAVAIWKGSRYKKDHMDVGVPVCWFLVSSHSTKRRLPGSEKATEKDLEGVITEIHRPKGGIIHLSSDKDVWFHRTRLYVNGKKLGINDVLEDAIQVGDTVHCNILPNGEQTYVDDPVEYVGLLVWKGEKPDQGQQSKSMDHVLRAKILKLDHPQDNGVESGLLLIQGPGTQAGKKVAFDRRNVYFYGLSLEKTDLAYLINKDDLVFCTIEEMPENEGGTVTHKANIVWFGQRYGPDITDEIKLAKFSPMVRHLNKLSLDVDVFERLISGELEPKHKRVRPLVPPRIGTVSAKVTSLVQPFQGSPVEAAIFTLEHGRTSRQKIRLHRNQLKVWGISMQKADLSYIFQKDDRIVCNLKETNDTKFVKYKAENAWVGSSSKIDDDENMEELEKDATFMEWLNGLSLDMDRFRELVQGKITPRMYLPFKSEVMKARVISVDPPQRKGIQSGTLIIEKGNLRGKQASFHRRCMFVYGHNVAKADLGYLLVKDQKIFCEIQEMIQIDKTGLKRNRREYKAVLCWIGSKRPCHDPKSSTIEKSAYPGFEGWLKKRNLNMQKFTKLIEGKLRPLPRKDLQVPVAGDNYMNERSGGMILPALARMAPFSGPLMPPAWLPGMNPQFSRDRPFPPPLLNISRPVRPLLGHSPGMFMNPVTMYKKTINRMLTAVMNINSLDDPVLSEMIQDEETAQLIEFISKAFMTVLDKYYDRQKDKQKNMNPMWSHMMGIGGLMDQRTPRSGGSSSSATRAMDTDKYRRSTDRGGGYNEFDDRKRQRGPEGRGDAPYSKFYRVDDRMDSYRQPRQGYQFNYRKSSDQSGYNIFY